MAKQDRYIEQNLMPSVRKNLKNPEMRTRLNRLFQKIYNANYNTLTEIAPMKIILFTNEYKEEVYAITGLEPTMVKETIIASKDIKSDAQVVNPFTVTLVCLLKGCLETKDEKLVNSAAMLFTLFCYPLLYTKYFKFDPNESIMRYTVANMSNKFKIRQLGSLIAALVDMSNVCISNNRNRLKTGDDKDTIFYILDLRNRMNDMFKNIRNEFDIAHKNQNYIVLDQDDMSEQGYHETDGMSVAVQRVSNAVTTKFSNTGLNYEFSDYAAKVAGVSQIEFRNYMKELYESRDNDKLITAQELVTATTNQYIQEGFNEKTIRTTQFFMQALKIYRKTGNDPDIVMIHNGLNNIINKYTTIGKKVKRPGSLNGYRKAIFTYFVLLIQRYC